jgi:phosphoglycerate dehydrogenase-like enzyme
VPATTPVVTVPEQVWVDRVAPWPSGVEPAVWDLDAPAGSLGGRADRVVMVVLPYLRTDTDLGHLAGLPALRLVQTLTAGYEAHLDGLPIGVALANAAGVHDASTAELAVGLVLASLRGIDRAVRDLPEQRWAPSLLPSLADRRVLLVGSGGVGDAVRRRLEPFEVELTRVASRARDDAAGHVHGIEQVAGLLPRAEVVVLACPLTDATRGLVDARFLAAMPDGALLVNVARGPVVDTGALLAELGTGRLHAALDVVDPEPPPAGHPLWSAPNLLMTPHVGGATSAMAPRATALLRTQVGRLAAGEQPLHVVATG